MVYVCHLINIKWSINKIQRFRRYERTIVFSSRDRTQFIHFCSDFKSTFWFDCVLFVRGMLKNHKQKQTTEIKRLIRMRNKKCIEIVSKSNWIIMKWAHRNRWGWPVVSSASTHAIILHIAYAYASAHSIFDLFFQHTAVSWLQFHPFTNAQPPFNAPSSCVLWIFVTFVAFVVHFLRFSKNISMAFTMQCACCVCDSVCFGNGKKYKN